MIWFGEIERKLAKLSMTTVTYRSSSSLFYAVQYLNYRSATLNWAENGTIG